MAVRQQSQTAKAWSSGFCSCNLQTARSSFEANDSEQNRVCHICELSKSELVAHLCHFPPPRTTTQRFERNMLIDDYKKHLILQMVTAIGPVSFRHFGKSDKSARGFGEVSPATMLITVACPVPTQKFGKRTRWHFSTRNVAGHSWTSDWTAW